MPISGSMTESRIAPMTTDRMPTRVGSMTETTRLMERSTSSSHTSASFFHDRIEVARLGPTLTIWP